MTVGNDIVDLRDAGEPSPRFLERVLAPAERQVAARGGIWRLWAAKEAAFKVLARETDELVFAHRRFVVDVEAGRVRHDAGEVAVRWEERAGALGCVGWRGDAEVFTAVDDVDAVLGRGGFLSEAELRNISGRLSIAARLLCKRLLGERLAVDESELEILRPSGRAPEAWRGGRRLDGVQVSLSHDGQWVACAVALKSRMES